MLEIISSFYFHTGDSNRSRELEKTLTQNMNKSFINKIHLFITQNDLDLFLTSHFIKNTNFKKLMFIIHESQPTYKELYLYSSTLDNKICCICNSDIEFFIENNNLNLLEQLNKNKIMFFLTRHEDNNSYPLIENYGGSHDAFIFNSSILKKSLQNCNINKINYIQNTLGIEALLIIFFIEELQYSIYNPCFQIKLLHHHQSEVRSWKDKQAIRVGYISANKILDTHPSMVHCGYLIYPGIFQFNHFFQLVSD